MQIDVPPGSAAAAARWPVAVCALLAMVGCGLRLGELPLPHDQAPRQQVAAGRQLMTQYQCGSCHQVPGVEAARGHAGPPLEGFGRRSYIAGQVPNGPAALAHWIEAPDAVVPGTPMPSMGVAPDDARAIAAYLLTLR